jgi:hypothetical protein
MAGIVVLDSPCLTRETPPGDVPSITVFGRTVDGKEWEENAWNRGTKSLAPKSPEKNGWSGCRLPSLFYLGYVGASKLADSLDTNGVSGVEV